LLATAVPLANLVTFDGGHNDWAAPWRLAIRNPSCFATSVQTNCTNTILQTGAAFDIIQFTVKDSAVSATVVIDQLVSI
jgi:hypothetical protein